jgi:cyclin B
MDKAKHVRQPAPAAKHSQEPPKEDPSVEDVTRRVASVSIDDADKSNVQAAAEYASDFYTSLFREESLFLPRSDYMDGQTDISAKMRTILIDWLIEVHMKYRLRPETLYLTVNLIDRYMTRTTVMRKRLQLVGVVAMFIASKFEEIHPPEIQDWVYITDNAYTKEDILTMECSMLTALSFQIMVPTVTHFVEGFQKANGCDDLHREVSNYLCELALLDMRMLQHAPSHTAAATLLLSNELLGRSSAWPSTMVSASNHTESVLRDYAEVLRQLLREDQAGVGQLQAVRKKYSDPKHSRNSVAKMVF